MTHRYGKPWFRAKVSEIWDAHRYDYRERGCSCGITMVVADWEYHVADQVAQGLDEKEH